MARQVIEQTVDIIGVTTEGDVLYDQVAVNEIWTPCGTSTYFCRDCEGCSHANTNY